MSILRFNEFTNQTWKYINLENNAYIKGRIGWKNLKQSEYTDEGPFLIAGKHIHFGLINWNKCDHITIERYEESIEIALKKGDIIFSKDGSLGNPALINKLPGKATINGTMMLVRVNNNISPIFFYQILNSDYFLRLIHKLKSGSSIPHIFQRDMKNFKFPITTLEEQKKIAMFLSLIDKKIMLLEKKLSLYQSLEKYFSNVLFSEKTRFPNNQNNNFSDWENYTLNNLGKTYTGLSGKSKEDFGKGKMYITYKSIFDNTTINTDKLDLVNISKDEKQNKVKFGDLFFTTSSETPEEVGMASVLLKNLDECYLNSFCFGYRLNSTKIINPLFMSYYLRSYIIRKKIMVLAQGSTRFNLSKNELMKLNIKIPCFEEQEKIADFLLNFNSKINNIQNEIQIIAQYKKGLLQQMFI